MTSRTDRELLTLAAKAAGMNVLPDSGWPDEAKGWFHTQREGDVALYSNDKPLTWNPLDDDGQALRLAVKLNMQIPPHTDWFSRPIGDPCEYVRRSIVETAAAFGAKS